MLSVPDAVATKLPHLPEGPGVYLWKGRDGTTLYVGKAKRLRSRVRSYFANDQLESVKTRHLVGLIGNLETIVVPTEAHALILEANLIKEYHPRFNIALRDDKSYPYIKVTVQEPFPRVFVTRRLEDDGAIYFGPYTDVGAMRRALNVVKKIFTVRSCNYDMPAEMPERPCLDYYIHRCKAPCILAQSQMEYRAMIDEVVLFLEGRPDEVMKHVKEQMESASSSLDYERAAELRNALRHLEQMEEPTVVLEVEEDSAILSAYLAGSYVALRERAKQLLVPFDFDDRELLEQSLPQTKIHIPQRGSRREMLDLAQKNARHLLEELRAASTEGATTAGDPVYELGRELGLQRLPRTLVCFDISTTQGTDTVGAGVWFENGRARRGEYRKFRVKTVEGSDDFASMREVVSRYFQRRQTEEKLLPDLIVIDGGKGQLSAAHEALATLGLDDRPLVSLAKREEEVFVWGREEPIRMSRRSTALRLLQQIRDEAHRFAVTYNRKRRTMRTVTSELLKIPGIGPVKRRRLLQEFGSIQGVREAGADAIAKVPGFNAAQAKKLLESLAATSPV